MVEGAAPPMTANLLVDEGVGPGDPPSQRALGFGVRSWVVRSTATSPNVGL